MKFRIYNFFQKLYVVGLGLKLLETFKKIKQNAPWTLTF